MRYAEDGQDPYCYFTEERSNWRPGAIHRTSRSGWPNTWERLTPFIHSGKATDEPSGNLFQPVQFTRYPGGIAAQI